MSWPNAQDYNEAIQNSATSLSDPSLKTGEVVVNAMGLPVPFSGNFADVYQFKGGDGKMWAVKCFTRQVQGLQERYTHIGEYLAEAKLPFTVGFKYIPEGIRIRGQWYPILKMEWVEGLPLNIFVKQNVEKPQYLHGLGEMWGKLTARLRDANFAHADLQHGNVLLVPGSSPSKLGLKLIDYDGMWVPALAKSPSGEVGHPNYQHPLRKKEQIYNADVDRVPHLVISAALRATLVGGKAIWEKFDNGDNLLFREADLANPAKSTIFKTLWNLGDPVLRTLIGHLALSVGQPLRKTPWLDDILFDKAGPRLTTEQEKEVCALLGIEAASKAKTTEPTAPVVAKEFNVFANIDVDDSGQEVFTKPSRRRPQFEDEPAPSKGKEENFDLGLPRRRSGPRYNKAANSSNTALYIGGGVLALALIGGVLAMTMKGKKPSPTNQEVAKEDTTHETTKHDLSTKKDPLDKGHPGTKKGPLDKTRPKPKYDPNGPAPTTGEQERALPAGTVGYLHSTPIISAVTLPGTGLYAYIAEDDPAIYIGVVSPPNKPRETKRNEKPLTNLAASGNGLRMLTADNIGGVQLWSVENRKEQRTFVVGRVHVLKQHGSPIKACALSADGSIAVGIDQEGLVSAWKTSDAKLINKFTIEGAQTIAVLPDGKHILSATDAQGAGIWDLETGEVKLLKGQPAGIRIACVSSDGKTGYTAGDSGDILMWNLEKEEQPKILQRTKPGFRALALSPDDRYLASYGEDECLVFWDTQKGKQISESPESDPLVSLSFFSEGNLLLCGVSKSPDGGSVRIVPTHLGGTTSPKTGDPKDMDVAKEGLLKTSASLSGQLLGAVFSSDGTKIYAQSQTGTLHVLDAKTLEELEKLSTLSTKLLSMELLPKHTLSTGVAVPDRLYVFDESKHLKIWEPSKGNTPFKDISFEKIVTETVLKNYDVTITPHGNGIILLDTVGRGKPYYWDTKLGKEGIPPKPLQNARFGKCRSIVFSPDGKIGAAYVASELVVWSALTQETFFDKQTEKPVSGMILVLEASAVIVRQGGNILQGWNYSKRTELWREEAEERLPILATAAVPKSSTFITIGQNNTVRLRDAKTGKELSNWKCAPKPAGISVSADGKYAVSVHKDTNQVQLWGLPNSLKTELKKDTTSPKEAPKLVVTTLTATQWIHANEFVYEFKKDGTFVLVDSKRHGKFVISLDQKEIALKWEGEKRPDEVIMVDPASDRWTMIGKPFVPKK